MTTISSEQFITRMREQFELVGLTRDADAVRAVCGPGRSGAVAAVYASHMLGVPFVPYDRPCPEHLKPLLVVDTATKTGRTLRKAERRHPGAVVMALYDEPPRVHFWYEAVANDGASSPG